MCGEDTAHYIFIDADSKRFVDLLRDPRASEPWVALLQFDDSLDEFPRWALGPRLSFSAR